VDEQEARWLLAAEIKRLRSLGYDHLRRMEPDAYEVTGSSGATYTVEIQAWDDDPKRPDGDLRVIVSIDDGRGYRAIVPLTQDFIIAPDGTFVDEA
jgi:hypothetical protein